MEKSAEKWAISLLISLFILCGGLYLVMGLSKWFGVDFNELFKIVGSVVFLCITIPLIKYSITED